MNKTPADFLALHLGRRPTEPEPERLKLQMRNGTMRLEGRDLDVTLKVMSHRVIAPETTKVRYMHGWHPDQVREEARRRGWILTVEVTA